MGGVIDRLYAATHPRQVAGLVLVDPLAEFMEGPLDPTQFAAYNDLNNGPIEELGYPDLEQILFGPSFAQMRRAKRKHPLPDIPSASSRRG